jgi:type II secretory ATPase GspE/PulE/Tfp pilus assembly ATPase PilB-like protein
MDIDILENPDNPNELFIKIPIPIPVTKENYSNELTNLIFELESLHRTNNNLTRDIIYKLLKYQDKIEEKIKNHIEYLQALAGIKEEFESYLKALVKTYQNGKWENLDKDASDIGVKKRDFDSKVSAKIDEILEKYSQYDKVDIRLGLSSLRLDYHKMVPENE